MSCRQYNRYKPNRLRVSVENSAVWGLPPAVLLTQLGRGRGGNEVRRLTASWGNRRVSVSGMRLHPVSLEEKGGN